MHRLKYILGITKIRTSSTDLVEGIFSDNLSMEKLCHNILIPQIPIIYHDKKTVKRHPKRVSKKYNYQIDIKITPAYMPIQMRRMRESMRT